MKSEQRILIVDDQPGNLLALEETLAATGAQLVRATSGEEALAATLKHEYALAIIDVKMPGMDGYELAALLRGDLNTRHLPIVFLSGAFSEEWHVFKGYESGAVDYIVKPYSPFVLIAKVRVFLTLDEQRQELACHRNRLEELVSQRTAALVEKEKELRKLAHLLATSEARERERVARRLHDDLQQMLVAAKMRLQMARRQGADASSLPLLYQAEQILDDSQVTCRSLCVDLHPPELRCDSSGPESLRQALVSLGARMRVLHGIEVTSILETDASPASHDSRLLLYCAARELLFNVVKHAGSKRAFLELGSKPKGRVQLVVRDEGRGFAARSDKLVGSGLGLLSLRERVTHMGGTVRVHSRPGEGSEVVVELPMNDGDAVGRGDAADVDGPSRSTCEKNRFSSAAPAAG